MVDLTILELHDLGNDVLRVRGTDGTTETVRAGTEDDGTPITEERQRVFEATGWVSALTNHYDEAAYDPETGHRDNAAKPRAMVDDERTAYAVRLLREQNEALREGPRDLLAGTV